MASRRYLSYWPWALLALLVIVLPELASAGDMAEGPWGNAVVAGSGTQGGPPSNRDQVGNNCCKRTDHTDPVDLSQGEFLYERTDLVMPGLRSPLDFTFKYRSQRSYNSHWGYGWYFPYEMRLFRLVGGDVQWRIGTGEEKTFVKSGSSYIPPSDHHVTLTQQMDGSWVLKEKFGTTYLFSVEGLLTQMTDTANNSLQFVYALDGFGGKQKFPIAGSAGNVVALDYRLTDIVSTLGKSAHFTYYTSSDGAKNGRIKTLSDDYGRLISYDYDSAGNLISVTSPSTTFQDTGGSLTTRGRVTTFTYSSGFRSTKPGAPEEPRDHNLLTITDDRGLVQLANVYDANDRVSRQDFNGSSTSMVYTVNGSGVVTRVEVTDGNGFVHRHDFDTNGNETASTVLTTGIHASSGSYLGSTYTYDSAQQVTEIRQQLGNGVEFTYDAQGNVLERRAKTSVTASNGATDIVSSYTYESSFNHVKTATDPLGFVTTYFYDYEEATLGDKNGDGITTQAAGNLVRVDYPNALLPDGTTSQTGISVQYRYNAYGQLIKTIDPEGHVVERQYYPSGNAAFGLLSKVIADPAGLALTTELTYDTFGFVASVKDPRNTVTNFTSNSIGELTQVDAPLNVSTKATYDANGNVVKSEVHNTDETGTPGSPEWIKSVSVYDAWNRCTSVTDDVSGTPSLTTRTTTFAYDGLGNVARITSPEGRVTTHEYDEQGMGWRTVAGVGSADATSAIAHVDNNWRVTQSFDGRNGLTSYAYDLFDRVTSVTDPVSNSVQVDWNKRSEVTERRLYHTGSVLATKVDATYDSLGRRTRSTQIDVTNSSSISETWFEFNKASLIKRVRSPRGYYTTFDYDAANRANYVLDPIGNLTTWTMDANGNPLVVTELEKVAGGSDETYTSSATWDVLNRPLTQTSVDRLSPTHQPTTSFKYDSRSQVVEVTDPIGRKMRSAYDLAGRTTSTIEDTTGLAITTQYGYDNDNLATSLIDASSNTTSWTYDALGRRTRATYPTGLFEEWGYDPASNVLTYRSQDGVVTAATYFANNLLKDRTASSVLEEFTWNGFGAPKTAKETVFGTVTSNITYAYDGFGRLSSEAQDSYTVSYGYDAGHNLATLTYPDSYVLTHSYDALDRLATVTDTGGTIGSYTYAGPGRIKTRTTGVTQTNVFDGLRRLTGIQAGANLNLGYGYDDVDRRLYKQKNHQGGIGDVYGYDTASRLSDVWYDATNPSSGTSGYTGDFHVVQSLVDDRTQTTTGGTTTTYNTPDSLHQYTQIGAAARLYDNKGNLSDDGSQLFDFDPWNRLTKVKDKASGAERARYELDSVGRRTKKYETGLTTRYVYAGARLLGEYEDTGGGPVFKRRYIYGSGMDEALALESAGSRYWMYQDALGSTEAITDLSNVLVERYSYDGFGQPTVKDGSGAAITGAYGRPASNLKNALWFTGSRWDNESGHYHMRARQYEPGTGRFVSRDPLGYVDGPNPYTYGMSSPTDWVDPFGRKGHCSLNAGSGQQKRGGVSDAMYWAHHADELADAGAQSDAEGLQSLYGMFGGENAVAFAKSPPVQFVRGVGEYAVNTLKSLPSQAVALDAAIEHAKQRTGQYLFDYSRLLYDSTFGWSPLVQPQPPTLVVRDAGRVCNDATEAGLATCHVVSAPFNSAGTHLAYGINDLLSGDFRSAGTELTDAILTTVGLIVPALRARALAADLLAAGGEVADAPLVGRKCEIPINRQKQAGHIWGTKEHTNRLKTGKLTSTFFDSEQGEAVTREAWDRGTPLGSDGVMRLFEFNRPIGRGPEGVGYQTQVRVSMNQRGQIHGSPWGPVRK